VADPEISKTGHAEGDVSSPSYFIANAFIMNYTRFMQENTTCLNKF